MIIGIIAAVTINILVMNHNAKIRIVNLKRTYSVLSQVFKKAEVAHGFMDTWDISSFTELTSNYTNAQNSFIDTYMIPYLHNGKSYTAKLSDLGYKKGIFYPDKTTLKWDKEKFVRILKFNDVTSVIVTTDASNPEENEYHAFKINFYIDTDGPYKGPNALGRDIFVYEQWLSHGRNLGMFGEAIGYYDLQRHKVIITGSTTRNQAKEYCKQVNENSRYCGLLIKKDSWQISDDYPWK